MLDIFDRRDRKKIAERHGRLSSEYKDLLKCERSVEQETRFQQLSIELKEFEDRYFNASALDEIVSEADQYGPLPGDADFVVPETLEYFMWNLCLLEDKEHYVNALKSSNR